LGPAETLRFDRAMYRYWLWLEMLQQNAVWKEKEVDDDDDDDDSDDEDFQEELRDEFVNIVKSMPSEELLGIIHVGAFVGETSRSRASWSSETYGLDYGGADPATLAISLADVNFGGSFHYRSWDPIQDSIKDMLLSRNVKPDQLHDNISSAIVTTVIGAGDKCSRCQSVGGANLLGTQNMFLISGLLPIRERISFLPGLLPRNREECKLIYEHI
ncbi:hypothetical protein LXA43DRAFT_839113, partial [Ganoderma leucocontextum]